MGGGEAFGWKVGTISRRTSAEEPLLHHFGGDKWQVRWSNVEEPLHVGRSSVDRRIAGLSDIDGQSVTDRRMTVQWGERDPEEL